MDLVEYAKSELARIGRDEDGMQDMINKDILSIVEMFSEQGHSGFSGGYTLSVLERLLRFKPLTPLTGEDDEWNEISHGTQQNKRCSSVFRNADGTAHDIDGIIVSDNGGITWFSSGRFRKEVTFPYTPPTHAKQVYIEYKEDVPPGFTGDEYEIITDDPARIKALYERKRRDRRVVPCGEDYGRLSGRGGHLPRLPWHWVCACGNHQRRPDQGHER